MLTPFRTALVLLVGGSIAIGPAVSLVGGPEPQVIRPRSIAAFSFLLGDLRDTSRSPAWEVSFPPEWSPLSPVSGTIQIPPGEEARLLVLFSVSAEAAPGPGTLTLILQDPQSGEERARFSKPYTVLAAGRLVLRPVKADPLVFGDAPYRVRSWLDNGSNVSVRVELEAVSSRGWRIDLPTPVLDLAPAAGAWVEVLVTPPRLWEPEVRHTVTLRARTRDLPEGQGEATFRDTTRILSGRDGGTDSVLRGSVELEGFQPSGRRAGLGVNLRLAGDIRPHQRLELRVGEVPVGDKDALARRDTYLDLADDRWGGFLVGRTTRPFTRLTATNQRGEWGEVRLLSKVGTWAAFSSLSEPDTVWGRMAGLSLNLSPGHRNNFRFLAFQGERAPNAPEQGFSMVSFSGRRRAAATWWEAEIAAARLEGSGEIEPAWHFGLTGEKGRWSWSGETLGTSVAFPGTLWNHRQIWVNTSYRLRPSLRVWVGGERLRSPDLDLDSAVDSLTGQVGITWSGLTFGSLSFSHSQTFFEPTFSEPESAVERLWKVRVDGNLGTRLVATSELGVGKREESGRSETVVRTRYALRYRPSTKWAVEARFQPAPRGEEVFDSSDRWTLLSRWQTGTRSWLEFEGEKFTCGRLADSHCETEPSLRVSLGQMLQGRREGWRLLGFLQRRGGQEDITTGIKLARNLEIGSPFRRSKSRVSGTLQTSEGSPGPAGVRVYLGTKTAVTNPEGKFQFGSMPRGEYDLRVEPQDLGLSLMVDPSSPLSVRVSGTEPVDVSLPLVPPGRIKGQVLIERRLHSQTAAYAARGNRSGAATEKADPCPPRHRAGSRLAPGPAPDARKNIPWKGAPDVQDPCFAWEPFERLGLHFQHTELPQLREVAVSGLDGGFSVAGLLPGTWRVSVDKLDVPAGREVVRNEDQILVEVPPGGVVVLDPIFLRWRLLPETLLEIPSLSLARYRQGPFVLETDRNENAEAAGPFADAITAVLPAADLGTSASRSGSHTPASVAAIVSRPVNGTSAADGNGEGVPTCGALGAALPVDTDCDGLAGRGAGSPGNPMGHHRSASECDRPTINTKLDELSPEASIPSVNRWQAFMMVVVLLMGAKALLQRRRRGGQRT